MMFAKRYEDPPEVWGVSRVVVDGRSVLPGDLWEAVERVPETSAGLFQVIRAGREVDRLRLRVGYATEGARGVGDLRTRVTDSVHEAVGIAPDVELDANEVLLRQGPPHKIPRVAKR